MCSTRRQRNELAEARDRIGVYRRHHRGQRRQRRGAMENMIAVSALLNRSSGSGLLRL
jgi:hypothetical protein